jgi:hypothetical protein
MLSAQTMIITRKYKKHMSPKAKSAISVCADSVKKIRVCDAFRLCDEAFKMGCLIEIEKILKKENYPVYSAFCEYRDEEYGGIINFAKSHKK